MLDAEKFISEVEKYPLLYDHRANNRRNKAARFKCWFEVGQAMFENWHTLTEDVQEERSKLLITKWKLFRDCFVRDYREMKKHEEGGPPPKKSKYLYYDNLRFLAPYVYGGVGYKPPADADKSPGDVDKNTDDVDKSPGDVKKNTGDVDKNTGDVDKNSDDVDKQPVEDVTQLLECVYGEDDETDDSKSEKSPSASGTSVIQDKTKFTLKCMRIKLPEKWSREDAAKSTDDSANEKDAATTSASASAQNSNSGPKFRPIVPKPESVPMYEVPAIMHQVPTYTVQGVSLMQNVPAQLANNQLLKPDRQGNRAFLMSFVPIMDNLPPSLSLQARMRISEVFKDIASSIPRDQGFYTQL